MNPLAQVLNEIVQLTNLPLCQMFSEAGKTLYFPRGTLTESAEAKKKGHRFKTSIGMATEKQGVQELFDTLLKGAKDLEP